jgi:formylmethanofuran dehydrogenase subunit A
MAKDIPIVGAPQQEMFYVDKPDGGTVAYPVVMVHLFSDVAMGTMFNNIRQIINQELDARGLTPIRATASDSRNDDTT